MSAHLVRPELALRDLLKAMLGRSNEILFAVAYIDHAGVSAIRDVLAERLGRKRFRLRILFRATDLRTEPAALDELLQLATDVPGTLAIRYSRHPKFHAKAFGFRRLRASRPAVILGSANMLQGALSTDSGELGVLLDQSSVADEAWDVMEDFWTDGQPVRSKWLAAYRKRHDDARRKSEAANRAIRKWAKSIRRRRRSFQLPDLARERFYVVQTEPRDAGTNVKAKRAAKAAESCDVEIPEGYYTWHEKPGLPSDTNLLELFENRNGLRFVRLVRLGKVVRVVDPKSKDRLWLVGLIPARRGRLELRPRDAVKNERKLAKLGFAWRDLVATGYPRGRKARLIAALHALGWPLADSSVVNRSEC
jgi:HKD family nuclease